MHHLDGPVSILLNVPANKEPLYFNLLNELPLLYQSKQKMTIPSHYPLNAPDIPPK